MKGRQNILHADVGKLVIRCGFKIKNRTECPHTYTTLQLLCFTLLYLQCWGSTGVPQKPHVSAATENLVLVYIAMHYIYMSIYVQRRTLRIRCADVVIPGAYPTL